MAGIPLRHEGKSGFSTVDQHIPYLDPLGEAKTRVGTTSGGVIMGVKEKLEKIFNAAENLAWWI